MEGVFETYAPGTRPSYEQYYLNDEIEAHAIPVVELPTDLNCLFWAPTFPAARLQHYTGTPDAKSHVHAHARAYFAPATKKKLPAWMM